MEQQTQRFEIRFSGRVQGVGFRMTARRIATGYRVTGWVRNEPDGTVLMNVQGPNSEVEDYLTALRNRMGANITREDTAPLQTNDSESAFDITY